ncbi:hypothetical protein [uncultured Roseibium sp.]|uniref:hypothetical protein n=1 Tax=uncultured Roseibium sp. TaxID=1936171 RepID=UPI0026215EDA|nr:hypothetical protein [uncultured Roseibium sp.]
MISEEAYEKLRLEVASQNLSDGELAESVHLYLRDYWSVSEENPNWSKRQIEQTLLRPTGVTSLVNRASENYLEGALSSTRSQRRSRAVLGASKSVLLGVISNIIFTLIMILFFLSAQDISSSFFRSLGFEIVPQSSQSGRTGTQLEDLNAPGVLPAPTGLLEAD